MELYDFEYAVLKEIYNFSVQRGFRLWINQRYLLPNIGYRGDNGRFENALQDLFDSGLIFYKLRHGDYYWIPTKLGREYIKMTVKCDGAGFSVPAENRKDDCKNEVVYTCICSRIQCGRLALATVKSTLRYVAAEYGVHVNIKTDGFLFIDVEFDFIGEQKDVNCAIERCIEIFGEA